MKIMVTGATGGYGRYAVDYVKKFAGDAEVFALVRDEKKAAGLAEKGIRVRTGDYGDEASLVRAFEGVDRLLFVSVPVFDLQKNVVSAAKKSGAGFIAYTSLCGLDRAKFGLEVNHRQTEALIRESGIPHTFLRNNWYLEIAAPLAVASAKTGVFPYFSGDARLSFALKREFAEAGARVVAGGDWGETLDLAGPPVTFGEIAQAAREASGKPIEEREVSREEFASLLSGSGISEMGLMLSTAYQDYALSGNNGEAELSPAVFEKVLGHALTPLSSALKETMDDTEHLL